MKKSVVLVEFCREKLMLSVIIIIIIITITTVTVETDIDSSAKWAGHNN
jgi:hypothetical protein